MDKERDKERQDQRNPVRHESLKIKCYYCVNTPVDVLSQRKSDRTISHLHTFLSGGTTDRL